MIASKIEHEKRNKTKKKYYIELETKIKVFHALNNQSASLRV